MRSCDFLALRLGLGAGLVRGWVGGGLGGGRRDCLRLRSEYNDNMEGNFWKGWIVFFLIFIGFGLVGYLR